MHEGATMSKLGRVPIVLASVLSVSAVLASRAESVTATTLVHASVEELTHASEHVALGVVVDVEPTWGGPNGRAGIFSRVTLRVAEAWRGPRLAAPGDVVFHVHGGRIGEHAMRVHGQATFEVGERVVVFLFRDGEALFPTGMSQGKWVVRDDGGGVAMASSSADPRALVVRDGPQGSAPYAGAAEVLTLYRLRARVRAAEER